MDPDMTLREQLELVAAIQERLNGGDLAVWADDVEALVERVKALDAWLTNGGSLPARWASELRDL